MNSEDQKSAAFEGEEGGGEAATPITDLIAAAVLVVISFAAIALAFQLDSPGEVWTAPGLLPILTGITLLAMAAGLALKAVRAGALKMSMPFRVAWLWLNEESRRTLLLMVITAVYVFLLDLVNFDLRMPAGGFEFRFSSYEAISIVALTLMLKLFWRAAISRCFLISLVWVIALASVFRYGFHILLPGSG
jgi:hypothetical protein